MVQGVRLSDEELVERIQFRIRYNSDAAAARAYGISAVNFNKSIRDAKARGLKATTKLQITEAQLRTKVRMLERDLATRMKDELTAAEVRRTIYGLAEMTPSPPRWLAQTAAPKNSGVPMVIFSDWHWGERVFHAQTAGMNKFNRKIAKQRVARLLNGLFDLTFNHVKFPNKYPGIVVALGGDMITGNIHDDLRETNDGPVMQSVLEVQEQLIMALTAIAERFKKVFVPCVVGNHSRLTHKPRMKNRVHESFEWNIYCQLERHFRNDPRVQFSIPEETDCHFKVCGHRFALTHGDSLGVKGGDGIIGALGPIARGTIKLRNSEAQIGRDFDTLLMGHYHTYIPRGSAISAIVNSSLIGYNEYARLGLRVPYSPPSQALWFVHPKYGITQQWQIYVDDLRQSADSAEWVKWEKRKLAA